MKLFLNYSDLCDHATSTP